MTDEQEHKRVRTVLDDVADANTARTMERLRFAGVKLIKPTATDIFHDEDFDPRIENSGKPLRIRGMVEDGKLTLPGEPKDG